MSSSLRNLRYVQGGLHLPELGLWLDAHGRKAGPERVFVSHAHTDHIGAHREVILTEPTAKFLQARLRGERQMHILPFGQPRSFVGPAGPFELTLLPAGHILGSAMARLAVRGETLLYTGDFKLAPGLAAERCRPRRADILVMETTFGRPRYQFPPRAKVWADILGFCRESLAAGQAPVLLGYALGKSQELLAGLARAGLPVALHPAADTLARLYQEAGHPLPPYEVFDGRYRPGSVLILPPQGPALERLRRMVAVRTAVCTGWAAESGCRFRYRADAAFPLSDHADFAELLGLVQWVAPQRVFTLHGFAADFAQALRDRGYDAAALSEPDQLGLKLFC